MGDKLNNALLGLYVRAAHRPRSLEVVRSERGQTFTDYLMVMALVALIIFTVGKPAKKTIGDAATSLIEGIGEMIGVAIDKFA